MVKSKYLTIQQNWDERVSVMESNLQNGYYDYLYFNIALNLIDARDNADYDKEKVLGAMMCAFQNNEFGRIEILIERLRNLI